MNQKSFNGPWFDRSDSVPTRDEIGAHHERQIPFILSLSKDICIKKSTSVTKLISYKNLRRDDTLHVAVELGLAEHFVAAKFARAV